MKALTVKQPWASLEIGGLKPVENRTWAVPSTLTSPFRLAIHAGRSDDPRGFAAAQYHGAAPAGLHEYQQWAHELPRGVLLGYVTVTGCHRACDCELDLSKWGYTCGNPLCSPWAEPEPSRGTVWHWVLADPVEFDEPIPMRGRQGLWTVPDDALQAVQP